MAASGTTSTNVIMIGDKFVRAKSYSEWTLVDSPDLATLYSRERDVIRRSEEINAHIKSCDSKYCKVHAKDKDRSKRVFSTIERIQISWNVERQEQEEE